MKKAFLVFSLLSCLFLNLMSTNNNSSDIDSIPNNLPSISIEDLHIQNSSKLQKIISILSVAPEKSFLFVEKVNATFNFTAAHIDAMLTKRGAIKTLLALGLIFALYASLFSPEPVMSLINKIVSSSAYGASKIASSAADGFSENQNDIDIAINKISDEYGMIEGRHIVITEIGQMNGLFQSIWEYPFSTIALLANKGTNMVLGNGVPFIAALLANNLWKRNPGG